MEEKKTDIKVIDERQKSEKVKVKVKKKGRFTKFLESFFVEDLKSVFNWTVYEVAIPALKKLLVELVDNTANSMVYGIGSKIQKKGGSSVSNVSYRDYYYSREPDRAERRSNYETIHRDIYSYGCTEVSNREIAKSVISHMEQQVSRYGYVTVAAVMEELDIQPRSTDFNYGWVRLDGLRYSMSGGWYEITFPRVMEISYSD